jgi:hypothetical protein
MFLQAAGAPSASWHDDAWTMAAGFIILAILTMVATNRAALRDHREHTTEQHSSLPLRPDTRVQGLLVAMAIPVAVATVLLSVMVAGAAASLGLSGLQAIHAVQLPLLVVMLGALGAALALWAPNAFVAPVVAIGFYIVAPDDAEPASWHVIWPFATIDSPGLAAWHLVYVLGVAALFAVVAIGRTGWRRSLVALLVIAVVAITASLVVMVPGVCLGPGRCLF